MTNAKNQTSDAAVTGLVNIYHVITGQECGRDVALGMATSAVSRLITERDARIIALQQEVTFLKGRFEHWFLMVMKARKENLEQAQVICNLLDERIMSGRITEARGMYRGKRVTATVEVWDYECPRCGAATTALVRDEAEHPKPCAECLIQEFLPEAIGRAALAALRAAVCNKPEREAESDQATP